ncbi:MAG: histidine phosphatase family protein [Rubrobacter sp.]|nr:histidine phosphatase family protein [Rubrobacter sp.]
MNPGEGIEVLLVRHGQSAANLRGLWQGQLDFPLSELGRAQAGRVGTVLREQEPSGIYSSPLARAAETARISARVTGYPEGDISYLEDLRERHGGVLEGLTWVEFERDNPELARRFFELPDDERWALLGAESTASAMVRADRALAEVRSRHAPGETVVAVSHGGLLGSFFLEVFGPEAPGTRNPLGNGSITRLLLEGESDLRLLDLGSVRHLDGLCEAL